MTRRRLISVGKEAVLHAGQYAYVGRKARKRDARRLWITRISGALEPMGISYSRFIHAIKSKNIQLDRKILADLVLAEPEVFKKIVEQAKI